MDIPVPVKWIEMARDKFFKLTVIAERIREILEERDCPQNGIYVMPLDADDLLHNQIAEYCEQHPDANGFVSDYGYVWQEGSHWMEKYKDMHTFCGSCNIIKMYLDDLPEKGVADPKLCHDQKTAAELNPRYPIRYDHNTVVERYAKDGRAFSVLPFPSTVYVRGTGDNISHRYQKEYQKEERKRFHPIVFLRGLNIFKYKIVNKDVRGKYGLYF